jgi:hypothetical protein
MIEYTADITITPRMILETGKLLNSQPKSSGHFYNIVLSRVLMGLIAVIFLAAVGFLVMDGLMGFNFFMEGALYFMTGLLAGILLLLGVMMLALRYQKTTLPTIPSHFTFREEGVIIQLEGVVAQYQWSAYDHVLCGHEFWLLIHKHWTQQYHMLEVVQLSDELQRYIQSKLRVVWAVEVTKA